MEVKNPRSAMLSNYEVLSFLRELRQKPSQSDKPSRSGNFSTIVYEVAKYLEEMPCSSQSEEVITTFMENIRRRGFKLTKAECLQLLNNRPTSAVELQLLIEESVERFSEENEQELLELINTCLPCKPSSSVVPAEGAGSVARER